MTEQTVPTPGAHLPDQGSTPLAPATGAGPDREPTRAEEVFGAPPVDIFEDEDGLVVLADLPGVAPERLLFPIQQTTVTEACEIRCDYKARLQTRLWALRAPAITQASVVPATE